MEKESYPIDKQGRVFSSVSDTEVNQLDNRMGFPVARDLNYIYRERGKRPSIEEYIGTSKAIEWRLSEIINSEEGAPAKLFAVPGPEKGTRICPVGIVRIWGSKESYENGRPAVAEVVISAYSRGHEAVYDHSELNIRYAYSEGWVLRSLEFSLEKMGREVAKLRFNNVKKFIKSAKDARKQLRRSSEETPVPLRRKPKPIADRPQEGDRVTIPDGRKGTLLEDRMIRLDDGTEGFGWKGTFVTTKNK